MLEPAGEGGDFFGHFPFSIIFPSKPGASMDGTSVLVAGHKDPAIAKSQSLPLFSLSRANFCEGFRSMDSVLCENNNSFYSMCNSQNPTKLDTTDSALGQFYCSILPVCSHWQYSIYCPTTHLHLVIYARQI